MAKLVELDDFPPGNPFLHDHISVGMVLREATMGDEHKKWYIMSSGLLRKDIDFYLVNSETGERFGVKL